MTSYRKVKWQVEEQGPPYADDGKWVWLMDFTMWDAEHFTYTGYVSEDKFPVLSALLGELNIPFVVF